MIAADDDRRLDLARTYEVVDCEPCPSPVSVAKPTDPSWEPLEGNALRRQLQPPLEQYVVWEALPQRRVDRRDIPRIARQRRPPKRADSATEERSNIGRDKARV
jgi:hypothetical protein